MRGMLNQNKQLQKFISSREGFLYSQQYYEICEYF